MASQSRPEPMNASPHHSKVQVTLTLSDPVYVSGGNISGKMEVESRADLDSLLGIGVVMVELYAIQEVNSRGYSATSTFIHSRRIFQGPGLPPSNAVHPDYVLGEGEVPLPAHHHAARRGLTTFFFRFPLPQSSPSSINFGPANIRYEVRASVSVSWRGDKRLVTDKREVKVVEGWGGINAAHLPQAAVIAEGGKIWAQATITNGAVVGGETACIDLQLKNNSQRWTSGVTLTLTRALHLSQSLLVGKSPPDVFDVITQVDFRGPEYSVPPGTEGVASLVIDIPRHSRGVQGGPRVDDNGKITDSLFEVCSTLDVRIDMPPGSEDTVINLPLTIYHSLAIPEMPVSLPILAPSPYPHTAPVSPALPLSPPPGAELMNVYTGDQMQYYDPTWSAAYIQPVFGYAPHRHFEQLSYSWDQVAHSYAPPLHRSTSAEPHAQTLYYDPGLPATNISRTRLLPPPALMPHPGYTPAMLPIQESPGYHANAEDGKGALASRISQNLHQTARHRSVSPSPHRYPLPQTQPLAPTRSRPPPIQIPALPNPHDLQGVVYSPRPAPSPKHSFYGSVPKSDNVSALERMADEVGKQTDDLSADLPKGDAGASVGVQGPNLDRQPDLSVDRILPVPPVPSGRDGHLLPQRPRADTIFAGATMTNQLHFQSSSDNIHRAPPTPPIAAITPIKFPKASTELSGLGANLGRDVPYESGLDALERLLLAEVGTRRFEAEERPHIRSVVQPITIPPSGTVEAVNDSAISSLTLADRDGFLRGNTNVEREQEHDRDSDEHTQHFGGGHSPSDDDRDARTQKGKSLRKLGKSRHSDEDLERVGRRRERKKGRDDEGRKLRQEAKGRVAAWLGGVDTASPPVADDSFSLISPSASHFVAIAESKSFGPTPPETKEKSRERRQGDSAVGKGVSAAPNPRSSGFVTISSLHTAAATRGSGADSAFTPSPRRSSANDVRPRPSPHNQTVKQLVPGSPSRKLKRPQKEAQSQVVPQDTQQHLVPPRLPRLPPKPADPDVKYDVRSARGGKGGKVTQVASLWAAKASTVNAPAQKTSPPPRPIRKPPPNVLKKAPVLPVANKGPTGLREGHALEKGAKPAKATTVPAMISSSHAVPMLSSTASLSRTPASNKSRPANLALPPMISETVSDVRNLPKSPGPKPGRQLGDLAFGQARLRDLIKKYQG
ncbi:hypothetical protein PAXINDRAFT_116058 [Paxillus involutus ATCC 200175]|uniref:Arrestin-like N-terminal domain-containing protein n=1 Tax=Paxillus involutus ATCC 200175 TaxID=664439 RepID=A0A0C9U5A5_PAXIN|nr:hypothetical protein PAXINDRAFT_116058 [Paxillus involutus ATCC 200175]